MQKKPEILAPAGSPAVMTAALEAGADAVYFGLKKLNARRGATNFQTSKLAEIMCDIHSHGAKGYLTLNIDLTQRELGLATRILALAEQAKVDGVLIRDPALLEMRKIFPDLPFHFSTQAAVSSSAGVKAAQKFGISRVVLARELSKTEMDSVCRLNPQMEIEVFVQGALCFSCSGRCLMSSWVGGRSGNRGACASPCRVLWHKNQGEAKADGEDGVSRPLSMHDLCLLRHLQELQDMGVASLKIEGRLKTADWVRQAVSLYRKALDGTESPDLLAEQAESLGNYTGRILTDGYFVGKYTEQTGESARKSASEAPQGVTVPATPNNPSEIEEETACLHCQVADDGALLVNFYYNEYEDSLRIPPQKIANQRRAIRVSDILDEVRQNAPKTLPLVCQCEEDCARKQYPRRCGSAVQAFFDNALRLSQKENEDKIKIKLPDEAQKMLSPRPVSALNRFSCNDEPDRVRLGSKELDWLCDNPIVLDDFQVVISINSQNWQHVLNRIDEAKLPPNKIIIALPQVIYEGEHRSIKQLLTEGEKCGFVAVELNSWDGWELAVDSRIAKEAGPGMAVFNANAARFLHTCGCGCVAVSQELDKLQLEELSSTADTPLALTVFGRPPLMQTRAQLPIGLRPEDEATLVDGRHNAVQMERVGELTVLRPKQAFDWRKIHNPGIKAAHLVVDLEGSQDCTRELRFPTKNSCLFNYDRRLR